MKNKNYLYTSGEFAKLTGVNKRTLHYYNDTGIFCPEVVGDNGYHYYTCFQFAQLELILTLRKIGMSIEEIKEFTCDKTDVPFAEMIENKKKLIDQSIKQLLAAQNLLEEKAEKLKTGLQAEHGKITVCSFPERKIVRSQPISGKYDHDDFSVAAEFSIRLKKLFNLYDSFGSRISAENITSRKFDCYDSFFAYCPDNSETYDEILPKGCYLKTYCIGGWENIPQIYTNLLEYAHQNNFLLEGFAYEEGLNELSIKSGNDYITMITVKCKKIK